MPMPSADELLSQSKAAYLEGDRDRASELLARLIQNDPSNEGAWLWLSGIVTSDAERLFCMKRVLAINPRNDVAKRGISLLPAGLEPVQPSLPKPNEQDIEICTFPGCSTPVSRPGHKFCYRHWKAVNAPLEPAVPPEGLPSHIVEAIRLSKENRQGQSCQVLRDYLRHAPGNVETLLWLAKFTPNQREALAAAELALAIDLENEIAQRAVAKVSSRIEEAKPSAAPEVMRLTGLTLAQAKAVTWPFNGFNRSIGILLEEEKISPRDLAWASEHANDNQVRQAARTILLTRLLGSQLKDTPSPMRVISVGRSYSERQEHVKIMIVGIIIGVFAVAWVVYILTAIAYFYTLVSRATILPSFSLGLVAFTAILIGSSYLLAQLAERTVDEAEQLRQGAEGEKRVAEALRVSLPSPWTLVRDVEFPERKWGDIDLVLVGPGGVWAIEVKAYSSAVRNIGDLWQYQSRRGWRKLSKHPGEQARRHAVGLKDYLKQKGVDIRWVQALIVWAGEDSAVTIREPAVPVWKLGEVSDRLEEFLQRQQLNEAQIQGCVAHLEDALQQVKTKEEAAAPNSRRG